MKVILTIVACEVAFQGVDLDPNLSLPIMSLEISEMDLRDRCYSSKSQNSKLHNVDKFIGELQTFLNCLNLQTCHKMGDEVKGVPSKRLVKPAELPLSSSEQSSRFTSGTVYSPVTELSMNLGDLSTNTG